MVGGNGSKSSIKADKRSHELEDLIAQATLKYSVKDYDAAAELYSKATELQAKLHGEMAASNANLLYAYGRCLFHLAVRGSDVLGSKVAGEKQQVGPNVPRNSQKKKDVAKINEMTKDGTRVGGEIIAQHLDINGATTNSGAGQSQAGRHYFQFTGDENFDDSEDETEAQQVDGDAWDKEEEEEEEEDDDFANAFEVLDLARILLVKRIQEEEAQNQVKARTEAERSDTLKQLQERLADTHDLQAEISLEGERFWNAVLDLRAAFDLKARLYPEDSNLIAEAHYKLSLALEFSSMTRQTTEESAGDTEKETFVDEAMREESAKEMEAAIASCRLRISKEQDVLRTIEKGSNVVHKGLPITRVTQQAIDEVKDMVADMEQRLVELRQPPVSIKDHSKSGEDGVTPLSGILGSILGESPAGQQARFDEASKGAKDLSELVKRKKHTTNTTSETTKEDPAKTNGKRKVEFLEEVVEVGTGKKARLVDNDEET
ncbi:MAG: hypothetical protein Q9182_007515 [Xanthomendoza sp. 2 TL-2023]